MEHNTSAPNERVFRTTQLAKLSFNHPSVVLTADFFQYFNKMYICECRILLALFPIVAYRTYVIDSLYVHRRSK